MSRFLVDEDLSRSTAPALREAGYDAEDVRDVGLRGRSDEAVFTYAQDRNAILTTANLDFSSTVLFPLGSHVDIILVRVPDVLPSRIATRELLRALTELREDVLPGALAIVELGRTRLRRPQPESRGSFQRRAGLRKWSSATAGESYQFRRSALTVRSRPDPTLAQLLIERVPSPLRDR